MEKEIFLRSVKGGNGNVINYSYTQKDNKFYCHTSCSHPEAAGLDFEVTIDEIKEAIKDTLEEIEISNSILNSLTK